MSYILALLCFVSLVIAGYLSTINSENYGWFLFVAFLFGVWARDSYQTEQANGE